MPGAGERGRLARCLYCGQPMNPAEGACPVCGGPYVLQLPDELLDALQELEDEEATMYMPLNKAMVRGHDGAE